MDCEGVLSGVPTPSLQLREPREQTKLGVFRLLCYDEPIRLKSAPYP
jgi:hypothetical protein